MPAKELVVTGLGPLPAEVAGWEVELVEPILGPMVQEMAHQHRAEEEVEVDAAE